MSVKNPPPQTVSKAVDKSVKKKETRVMQAHKNAGDTSMDTHFENQ